MFFGIMQGRLSKSRKGILVWPSWRNWWKLARIRGSPSNSSGTVWIFIIRILRPVSVPTKTLSTKIPKKTMLGKSASSSTRLVSAPTQYILATVSKARKTLRRILPRAKRMKMTRRTWRFQTKSRSESNEKVKWKTIKLEKE